MTWLLHPLSTGAMRAIYRLFGFRYYYSIEEGVEETAHLYASASDTLLILSGELFRDVWREDLVTQALLDVTHQAPAVNIEIVLGPPSSVDPQVLRSLSSLASQDRLSLYTLESRPDLHFAVADGRHVKVEDPHEPHARSRSGYIAYNVPRLAALFETNFRFAKRRARPFGAK